MDKIWRDAQSLFPKFNKKSLGLKLIFSILLLDSNILKFQLGKEAFLSWIFYIKKVFLKNHVNFCHIKLRFKGAKKSIQN